MQSRLLTTSRSRQALCHSRDILSCWQLDSGIDAGCVASLTQQLTLIDTAYAAHHTAAQMCDFAVEAWERTGKACPGACQGRPSQSISVKHGWDRLVVQMHTQTLAQTIHLAVKTRCALQCGYSTELSLCCHVADLQAVHQSFDTGLQSRFQVSGIQRELRPAQLMLHPLVRQESCCDLAPGACLAPDLLQAVHTYSCVVYKALHKGHAICESVSLCSMHVWMQVLAPTDDLRPALHCTPI